MEVVVSASTGVLGAVLPKLADMLTDKYKLHKGAKEGIKYIRDELESMLPALEKVSEVPPDQLDKQLKLWARKLREMSYKIEDTVDSFIVRVDSAAEFGSSATCCTRIKSMLPRTYKVRRDIATDIERIKEEVKEVKERHDRYIVDRIVAPAPSDPRLPALYEDEAKLVGIDHLREEIIRLLSMEGEGASEQKLKLVSIVGPAGMGKTTLANAVYQKLEGKFDCTAFVSVSLQPDVKNILSSILRQVKDNPKDKDKDKKNKSFHNQESQKHNGNTETWSEKEIIDKIRHVLEKRRIHNEGATAVTRKDNGERRPGQFAATSADGLTLAPNGISPGGATPARAIGTDGEGPESVLSSVLEEDEEDGAVEDELL